MNIRHYWILYLPFVLSFVIGTENEVAYWVAWLGSWFILWVTLSGYIKPFPEQNKWIDQFLRPIVLPQIIFAGFTAITSIFYFLNLKNNDFNEEIYRLCIQAQQYYVLGHAALVHGVLYNNASTKPLYTFLNKNPIITLFYITIFFLLMKWSLPSITVFSQFAVKFSDLALVSSTLLLALSITTHPRVYFVIIFSGIIFSFYVINALLSGFKEQLIIPLLLLASFLYPTYKKSVIWIVGPILIAIFIFLPSYAIEFRKIAWENAGNEKIALQAAFKKSISNNTKSLYETNKEFLIYRFSEISMFIKYLQNVPPKIVFYDFQIINQSILGLLPRGLFPEKPDLEMLVMKRVRENGIIEHYSTNVSAKPPFVVDGYLSFGGTGVWLFCFCMGHLSFSLMARCERLFGGYLWGTCLMYTGLYQILWRGNCLEFMFNTIFWSIILMYLLFYIGRMIGLIKPVLPF